MATTKITTYGGRTRSKLRTSYRRHNKTVSHKNKDKKHKLIMGVFHAKWCGHCIDLMPNWDRMETEIKTDPLYKKWGIEIIKVEQSDPDKLANIMHINKHVKNGKFEPKYFPTIFKVKNGKLEIYNKGRTVEEMKSWFLETPFVKVDRVQSTPHLFDMIRGGYQSLVK